MIAFKCLLWRYGVQEWGRLKDLTHVVISISIYLSAFIYFSFIKGSVEAQCGLVLNGQGGVIRRGKLYVKMKHSSLI